MCSAACNSAAERSGVCSAACNGIHQNGDLVDFRIDLTEDDDAAVAVVEGAPVANGEQVAECKETSRDSVTEAANKRITRSMQEHK